MKTTIPAANYQFNAANRTITFSGAIPVAISNVMHVANITRGVVYFQPQAGPAFSGTYASPVLTLAASTTGHADSDQLLIVVDDGAAGALEAGGNLAGIRTDLGTDGGTPPTLPGGATGVRGWLRYVASLIPAPPFAVTGTFWQATQPISAASLPLPQGAATAAKQPALGTAGTPSADVVTVQGASGGTALPVAPTVQQGTGPVTATTTRITAANDGPLMAALGTPADAAVTDPTQSGSQAALLKGALSQWTALLARIPALVGGLIPVQTTASATDAMGNGTRAYDWANGLRQAVGSTSTAAIAFPALGTSREVMFHASQRCFVRMGDSNVAAASVAAGHLVVVAEERFHIRLPAGVTHFRVIRDSADGFLNVTAVL